MPSRRSETERQVAELLVTARRSLNLSLAFLSRLDGQTQHLDVVECSLPLLFRDGQSQPQETSLCQAVLDGTLPPVMPDVRDFPAAMRLPAARMPRIRSFISVPVRLSDGRLYGTFCAAGFTSDKRLSDRDKALMDVLAQAASVVIEPTVREQERRDEIQGRLEPLLARGGPEVVLQPIVELTTSARVGAEALSRFPADWGKPPDVCFTEAHSVDLGQVAEVAALRRAAEHLPVVTGYVSMNVSPATLLTPECSTLLAALPLRRVLLELSEHDPVEDYDVLRRVLDPLRSAGMRLAIDDVGAGFSSLRHIVLTAPDVIKLDRTLVDGVHRDPVLATLVRSLAAFATENGAAVVAEGVETAEDARMLVSLGVSHGQGWYLGRPGPPEALAVAPQRRTPQPARPARPRPGRLVSPH